MEDNQITAAKLYAEMVFERQPYLDRARDAANFTIPHIMPPDGANGSTDLSRCYQSLGARGVATISSKMLQSLFPTSQPNFQLKTDIYAVEKLQEAEGGTNLVNVLKANLAKVEQAVMNEFDSRGFRPVLHQAIKQLIVCGNVLVSLPEEGNMKAIKMDSYVTKRDHQGEPVLIIIKEEIMTSSLPEGLEEKSSSDSLNSKVDIYTKIVKDQDEKNTWHIVQEVNGEEIEETRSKIVDKTLPYLALRLEPVSGEDWGYGYVAQLIGDLITYEGLTQALMEASVAASKVVFLVSPNAIGTDALELSKAPNGAFVTGRADDVTVLTLGSKAADMSIAFQTAGSIDARLQKAFLLNSSFQRSQDRVTASEITIMAEELEGVLAGTYSLLAIEFQLPLITISMEQLESQGRIPEIPKDLVLPTITTGLNALGRGSELGRLDSFIGGASGVLGPTAFQYINITNYLDRRLTALGLLNDNLLKTQDQIDVETQQAAQQEAISKLGPSIIKEANASEPK